MRTYSCNGRRTLLNIAEISTVFAQNIKIKINSRNHWSQSLVMTKEMANRTSGKTVSFQAQSRTRLAGDACSPLITLSLANFFEQTSTKVLTCSTTSFPVRKKKLSYALISARLIYVLGSSCFTVTTIKRKSRWKETWRVR